MLSRAFTLIELLVVISVIALLSSVVLSSLVSARERAHVATIKGNLRGAVSQAELVYLSENTYENICNDEIIQSIIAGVENVGGEASCAVIDATVPSYPDDPGQGPNNAVVMSKEWGIAVAYDGSYYSASPRGVVTYDTENSALLGDQTITQDQALSVCSSAGKILPTISEIRALYTINNSVPAGFTASTYWSSAEYPADNAQAYRFVLSHGNAAPGLKSLPYYVRCVR